MGLAYVFPSQEPGPCRMSRGGMAPEKKSCLIAASVACALDTVPAADRGHWTELPGCGRAVQKGSFAHTTVILPVATAGNKAAQGYSLAHRAEMAALVLPAMTAGNRAAAGAVR